MSYSSLRSSLSLSCRRVAEMGFDRADALRALEENGWNEEAAVNSLLGM